MEENEKSYSRLEWFFYIVLFPLLFTIILAGLLLAFLGNDVLDTALRVGQNIPGISKLLPQSEQEVTQTPREEEVPNGDPDPEVEEVPVEKGALQTLVEEQENEIKQLKEQITTLEKGNEEQRATDEERLENIRQLAALYESMPAKKAAAIMENLTLREAALLMTHLPQHQQADILARLQPEKAAELTVVLKEIDQVENPDLAALQERVNTFIDSQDESKSTLSIKEMANTFTALPPQQAAKLLEEMSKNNQEFQLGIKILANLNDATRSAIIAQMQVDIAKRYVNSLLNS